MTFPKIFCETNTNIQMHNVDYITIPIDLTKYLAHERKFLSFPHCVRWNYETSTINNSLLRLSYANRKKFNLTENNNSFVERKNISRSFNLKMKQN